MLDKIESITEGHAFDKAEAKGFCARFLNCLLKELFRNGTKFVYKSRKLYKFSKVISYLRSLPGTAVDVSAFCRAVAQSQVLRDSSRRFYGNYSSRRFDKNDKQKSATQKHGTDARNSSQSQLQQPLQQNRFQQNRQQRRLGYYYNRTRSNQVKAGKAEKAEGSD